MARGDFTKLTKRTLAARAGNECSNPVCKKVTTGPDALGGFTNLGKAAHILPADPNGPRSSYLQAAGQVNVTDPENGIWLCSDCATMVDLNRGADYPPFVLRAWKCLQECTAALRVGAKTRRAGWVHSIEVKETKFVPSGRYELGPATLIIGGSPSGKSALVRLLTAKSVEDVTTWQRHGPFSYRIEWFDPHLRYLEIDVPGRGLPAFRMDGVSFTIPPCPLASTILELQNQCGPTTVCDAAKALDMTHADLVALLPSTGTWAGGSLFGAGRLDGADVVIPLASAGHELPLHMLSGGESAGVAVALAAARAASYGDARPALLALDPWPSIMQQDQQTHLDALTARAGQLQVVATSVSSPPGVNWDGWSRIVL